MAAIYKLLPKSNALPQKNFDPRFAREEFAALRQKMQKNAELPGSNSRPHTNNAVSEVVLGGVVESEAERGVDVPRGENAAGVGRRRPIILP
jgi:hypothetical protein